MIFLFNKIIAFSYCGYVLRLFGQRKKSENIAWRGVVVLMRADGNNYWIGGIDMKEYIYCAIKYGLGWFLTLVLTLVLTLGYIRILVLG